MTRLDGDGWSDVDDIDVWTVDRLLAGSLEPAEVPVGYEEIASLVGVVREGVAPAESGWGSQTVPAMVRILTAPSVVAPPRVRLGFVAGHARRASHVAAGVMVFAALGAAGTGAAATGSLPPGVQSAVHAAAADLGVSIPKGGSSHQPARVQDDTSAGVGTAPRGAEQSSGTISSRTGSAARQATSSRNGSPAEAGTSSSGVLPAGIVKDVQPGTATEGGSGTGTGTGMDPTATAPVSTPMPADSSTPGVTTQAPVSTPPTTTGGNPNGQGNGNSGAGNGNGSGGKGSGKGSSNSALGRG